MLAGTDSIDEVKDSSGWSKHGSPNGGDTGKNYGIHLGGGLFDGVDDHIIIKPNANQDNLDALTYMAWIYPTEEDFGYILDNGGGAKGLFSSDSGKRLNGVVTYSSTTASSISFDNVIDLNTWQHVAMTWGTSDDMIKLYKNGVEVEYSTSSEGSGVPEDDSADKLFIGAKGDLDPTTIFSGEMDEVCIYNRALSPSEITNEIKFQISVPANITPFEDHSYLDICSSPGSKINAWSFKTDAPWLKFSPNGTMFGDPINDNVGKYWVNASILNSFNNFTLEVIDTNDPPIIISDNVETAPEDALYSVIYNATDIDPTGDVFFWDVLSNTNFLNIDSSTGELSGIPKQENVGLYWVNVTVNDGRGGKDFSNFTLNVSNTNDPPEFLKIDDIVFNEDSFFMLNLENKALDVDDIILEWSVTGFDDSLISVSGEYPIYNISGKLNQNGITNATITVKDQSGGLNETLVNISVLPVNDPPNIVDSFEVIIVDGFGSTPDIENLTVTLIAPVITDMDSDVITIDWDLGVTPPIYLDGISVNFTYPAPGNYTVTMLYSDGEFFLEVERTLTLLSIPQPNMTTDDDDDDFVDIDLNDTDSDGLWDNWEISYFGNLNQTGDEDFDGDGISNLQEFSNGTNPTVKETINDDNKKDDDKDQESYISIIIIIVLLIIIIILIIAFVIYKKRRTKEPAPMGGDTLEAEVEGTDVFEEKKFETRISKKSGKAQPIRTLDVSSETGEIMPDLSGPDLDTGLDAEILEGHINPMSTNPDTSFSAPLALPPAKIFEAQFSNGPRIDEVFIMTTDGILIKHFSYKETSVVDEDILASMLTVIQNFVTDSFNKKKALLKKLEFGEFNILITPGEYLNLVAISPDNNVSDLEKPTNLMLHEVEDQNKETLPNWDGDQDKILGLEQCMDKLVNGGYD